MFEVKGYSSSNIDSVKAGSLFVRRDGLIRPVNAFRQAEQSMFDIKNQVERASGQGGSAPAFHAVVVLPNCTQTEWKNRGFAASFPTEVLLLKEELSPDCLKAKLRTLVARHQGRPLTPEQIETVRRVFGDSATINDSREARPEVVETSLGSVIDEMAVMDKYLSTEQSELSRLPIADSHD